MNENTSKTLTFRDILLGEHKNPENFDLESKLQTFPESNKKYLPLSERIKMFVSDNPTGEIECRVLMDNNIFASVEATITTVSGNKAVAVGKWYHSNSDDYGKNYLKTAQSNAVSTALKYLGYDYTEEIEPDPAGSQNVGEIMPLPFLIDDNQEFVPNPEYRGIQQSQRQNVSVSEKPSAEMTVEQAKSFIMTGAPFNGKSVGEILDSGNPAFVDELKKRFVFAVQQKTLLAPVANVILPLIGE